MMWGSAKKNKREAGWLVASLRPQELAIVHGRIGLNGKARIGALDARATQAVPTARPGEANTSRNSVSRRR